MTYFGKPEGALNRLDPLIFSTYFIMTSQFRTVQCTSYHFSIVLYCNVLFQISELYQPSRQKIFFYIRTLDYVTISRLLIQKARSN